MGFDNITTHRGIFISFSEFDNEWYAKELNIRNANISILKATIDKIIREELKEMDIKAIYKDYYGSDAYEQVTVTSIDETGEEVWIKIRDRRRKVRLEQLKENSQENLDLIQQIKN